jgi:Flp pilus assembly secretin CpaC
LEAAINHAGIKVAVTDGTITLTGTVASDAERERAGRLAELLGAGRVVNRIEVKAAPATGPGAGGPIPAGDGAGLTPQLTADLAMLAETGGETPVRLVIEQGRSHILSTGENLSKVIVADGEIVSAQVISARQAMLIGQKPGKTDAYLLVEQYPDDPVGALQRYEVEVPAPAVPPEGASPEPAPAGPPPVDPESLRMEIEDALTDFPAVTVSVLSRLGSEQSTLILRGEVPTAEDVQRIGEIAALFGGTVLNHTHAPVPPAAPLPPDIEALRAEQEQKLTQILQTALGEEAAAIRVQIRERGVVLLGTVRSDRTRQRAEQIVDNLADWQTIEIIAPRMFESGGTQRTSGNSEMAILNPAIEGFNRPGRRGSSSRTGGQAGGRGTGETPGIANLLEVVGDVQQVMTNARIIEIDRNSLTKLGIEWGTLQSNLGTGTSGSSSPRVGTVIVGESNGVGSSILRLSSLVTTLEMLEDSGKAHTLASPDLLALEGTRADFVVGGQVPIPTSRIGTGGGGGGGGGNSGFATQSVEFRSYGVILSVLPEATEGGHIVMQIRVEVSTPDYANGIVFQGTTLPGFRVRQATQSVAVMDGDTIVLGGLLSKEDQTQIQKIPFLSEIPFLGELFKKRTFKNGETELVIFLTPHITEQPASAETLEQTENLRDAERLDAPEVESSFGGGGGTGGGGGGAGGTGR